MNYFILAKIGNVNMKKTFQKTLIAAAAGVALMSAAGTASANSLLFPYFTTTAGAASILSLSMGTTAAAGGETLHYVYNYGSSCTHFDGNGKMTANDVLQHSIASVAAGGFGKVVGADTSTPFYFPLKDYGFLTVSTKGSATARISGEIVVYDPSNGYIVALPGLDGNNVDTTGAGEGDFTNITDNLFNLTTYPSALVTTQWYGIVTGNMNAAIAAGANWTGKVNFTNNGVVYDNEEAPYSGTMTPSATCAAILKPTDFMNAAQISAVGTNGSLVHAKSTPVAPATGIVMLKQMVIPVAGYPNGKVGLMNREQGNAY